VVASSRWGFELWKVTVAILRITVTRPLFDHDLERRAFVLIEKVIHGSGGARS
jgi:hypothetical protein